MMPMLEADSCESRNPRLLGIAYKAESQAPKGQHAETYKLVHTPVVVGQRSIAL